MCDLKHDFDVPALHCWAVGNCLSQPWAGAVLEVEMGLAEVEQALTPGCCDSQSWAGSPSQKE